MTKILIIEAVFYPEVSEGLLQGAKKVLQNAGAQVDVQSISGALEIPSIIAMNADNYDGFVALGCIIRGETYHFEVVANESARAIMDLTMEALAIGNGILTVENKAQALARSGKMDKGGFAAKACLELIEARRKAGAK